MYFQNSGKGNFEGPEVIVISTNINYSKRTKTTIRAEDKKKKDQKNKNQNKFPKHKHAWLLQAEQWLSWLQASLHIFKLGMAPVRGGGGGVPVLVTVFRPRPCPRSSIPAIGTFCPLSPFRDPLRGSVGIPERIKKIIIKKYNYRIPPSVPIWITLPLFFFCFLSWNNVTKLRLLNLKVYITVHFPLNIIIYAVEARYKVNSTKIKSITWNTKNALVTIFFISNSGHNNKKKKRKRKNPNSILGRPCN